MSVIAVLSDLGTKDYFVAAMKGVMFSINPDVKVIDITHEVPKGNVRVAAFTLANAAETFPKGTIFIAVVDPGVGTKRRCVLVQTKNDMFFIGPDNGIFTLVADRFGVKKIHEIRNKELMMPKVSPTFHGRDLMAPVAAHLSLGLNPSMVGPEMKVLKRLRIPLPRLTGTKIFGCILNIDDFGNLVTNIGAGLMSRFIRLGKTVQIRIGGEDIEARFVRTFGDVGPGENLCYIGSTGSLEIAKNMGNLAETLRARLGDKVALERCVKKRTTRSKEG
jgi:S-adenosylmethionine hydrolase